MLFSRFFTTEAISFETVRKSTNLNLKIQMQYRMIEARENEPSFADSTTVNLSNWPLSDEPAVT